MNRTPINVVGSDGGLPLGFLLSESSCFLGGFGIGFCYQKIR